MGFELDHGHGSPATSQCLPRDPRGGRGSAREAAGGVPEAAVGNGGGTDLGGELAARHARGGRAVVPVHIRLPGRDHTGPARHDHAGLARHGRAGGPRPDRPEAVHRGTVRCGSVRCGTSRCGTARPCGSIGFDGRWGAGPIAGLDRDHRCGLRSRLPGSRRGRDAAPGAQRDADGSEHPGGGTRAADPPAGRPILTIRHVRTPSLDAGPRSGPEACTEEYAARATHVAPSVRSGRVRNISASSCNPRPSKHVSPG